MSATFDESAQVFHCVICGPLFRFPCGDGSVTYHKNVWHPYSLDFDEEDNPQ